MADALVRVPGLEAVVLGGSRARGTHHDGSDVDLGLYYRAEDLDHDALTRETGAFSDTGRVEVAGPGGWGP
jgi:predicted nucleotidyltransferase